MPSTLQDKRSDATRRLLHQATIDSLIAVGYANTSLGAIAARAGLSRGALTYHYPGKLELIVAATGEMFRGFAKNVEELARRHAELDSGMRDFLKDLWAQMLHGKWFYSSLEMIVVARGDNVLRERLTPLIFDLHARFNHIWDNYFEVLPGSGLKPRIVLNIVMNIFRGMAVQAVLRRDPEYFDELRETLNTLLLAHVRLRRINPGRRRAEYAAVKMQGQGR